MKIHELLNEAPAGMLGQMGRRLGAAALRGVGAKGFAAGVTGRADQKELANRYYYEFRKWLGGTGGNINNVQPQDLRDFFKQKGIPDSHIDDSNTTLDPKTIDNIFNQTASDTIRGRDTGKSKNKAASQATASQSNVAQAARPQRSVQPTTAAPAATSTTAEPQPTAADTEKTPAEIRQDKQKAAAVSAQQQMAANPAPERTVDPRTLEKDKVYVGSDGTSYRWLGAQWQNMENGRSVSVKAPELATPTPETPEQKRIRLQRRAAKNIDRTAKAVATAPKVNPAV